MEYSPANGVGMSRMRFASKLILTNIISLILSSCYHPPYNNFKPYNRTPKDTAKGAIIGGGVGAGVGVITGAVAGPLLIGSGVGAVAFAANGLTQDNKKHVIESLQKVDIQYVQYGDTNTLVVPTDRYFHFNSPRLNELCYPGLALIVRLLRFYPESVIYVAGFTDNIGSRHHKKMLTQARAETMLTYLWANDIHARRLKAEGYGDKHAVSDNKIIHGSAQNRRLEIQWYNSRPSQPPALFIGNTK